MIKRSLVKKFVAESWPLWIALALGVVTFCWFRVWIVGELDSAQFRQIIDLLPKDWRKFTSVDFDWLVSYLGRTALCLDEPMLGALVISWSIVRGSDVVSGELNRGSMELLLAQPISRRQVYLSHAVCTVGGLAGLVGLTWLAMSAGIWTTSVTETTYPTIRIPLWDAAIPLRFLPPKTETIAMVTEVNPLLFFPGVVKLFFVGFFFAAFAACCSAYDRYRWRTLGIVAAFYFANAGVKLLGMASEKLSWLVYCNIFGFFSPARSIESVSRNPMNMFVFFERDATGAITGSGMLLDCLVMLILGVLFYAAGHRHFHRRDLPAPV